MGYLLAKSVLAAVTLSVQPTTRPQDAPKLPDLSESSASMGQLNQQLQSSLPLEQFDIKAWNEIPSPASPVSGIRFYPLPSQPNWQRLIPMSSLSANDIRPYGIPFHFNGLTVYVEPIAAASSVNPRDSKRSGK
jgi:hypothetical protein